MDRNYGIINFISKYLYFNPTKVGVSNGPRLLIYLSSHENHFYVTSDAPGLLIKFLWVHINYAAKTF